MKECQAPFFNAPFDSLLRPPRDLNGAKQTAPDFRRPPFCLLPYDAQSVAAMTALMVCMRFSASSKTMDCGPSNTSSVTSMQLMPNFS